MSERTKHVINWPWSRPLLWFGLINLLLNLLLITMPEKCASNAACLPDSKSETKLVYHKEEQA